MSKEILLDKHEKSTNETQENDRGKIKSLGGKIGAASLIVMGSIFLSRVLGQVRQSYIAYVGGASVDVDAYTIAFQVPDMLNHIVAGGFLSVTFIPIFAAYLESDREAEGWRIMSIIVTVSTAFLLVLIGLSMWTAPTLVSWVAPGISDDPATLAKAIHMTRIILPAQAFFFIGGILMAVQYAKGRFLIPSLAPLVYNLGIIVGGMAFSSQLGVEGFSWGVLMGAFVGQFVLQVIGAYRSGMRYRPDFSLTHPDFGRFLWRTFPLVMGVSMTFSMEFFFKFFGSMLGKGTVSALNYSLRTGMLLVALFGQAAGVASFPFLARLFAKGDTRRMVRTLDSTIRRFICLAIPASVLMMVTAREVVVILFRRGAFTEADVTATTLALQAFLTGAFAMAALNLVVRGFYATRSTWLPAALGSVGVALSVPLYVLFMKIFGGPGVALGVAVSALLQALILYTVWNHRMKNKGTETYMALGRAMVLTVPLAAGAWAARWALSNVMDIDGFWGALAVCALAGLVFLVGLVSLAELFRVHEITEVWQRVLAMIKRRAGQENL